MGIKGTVRRSTDGHIIHANIDTDVIIAEEPPYGQCYNFSHGIYRYSTVIILLCLYMVYYVQGIYVERLFYTYL